ncbi:response regulator [Sphingomonas pseudosanguinis]|uniref:histidine kinase n=2 Tax=Sphingomonas pseudosanguinis TaxID=413712 RepID=A0A7W6A968_9SPHN|nr:signal transduction histidine kinase [Sphingomonas pseudosanguinis]MBN3538391.1 response regulator [Sphingomonas pseudosanguinis]
MIEQQDLGGVGRWRTFALIAMAVAGAATLVLLIVTLGHANHERDRALELQSRSYDVMILARTLAGTIARSEASLGRYVISGDRKLGQLYSEEWSLAGAQLDRLDQLIENPRQQAFVDRLRTAYDARGDELSSIALSTTYHRDRQAYSLYYAARQADALLQINQTLNALIGGERTLLEQRSADASATVERSNRLAGGLALFGVALAIGGIFLAWMIIRAEGERAEARAEAHAERARAEELASAVEAATEELKVQEAKLRQVQKMDALGQLTGGIAHDFNNMLAVVLGGLELAKRASAPEDTHRHLDSATEGAHRAAALTRRLLMFSREEALTPEALHPRQLVTGMRDLLDRTLGDGVKVTVEDRTSNWTIFGDRTQMENAILNLAVNARDAMDGRGELTIRTAEARVTPNELPRAGAGDYAVISVADTGAGMTSEVAERVFEPFFTTKPAGKGTGLGLSQIFGLVGQMGGDVTIRTAPGAGTTVHLYFPRHVAAMPAPAPVEAAAPEAVPEDAGGLRILLVEDDPRVLAATMGALQELGHDPVPCNDPREAEGLLARHPGIRLIVSDVLMPHQTGPELIASLRPRYPDVAVLFVTGFAGDAQATGFEGHEVLRKPFTLMGLERAVAAALKRAEGPVCAAA